MKRHRPAARALQGLALCALSLLIGGCPVGIQNELVNGVETTVRGMLDAGLDALFDIYRGDQTN